jgi:YHS domain-containing protein
MIRWNRTLCAVALLAASLGASAARAADETNVARAATRAGPGLAVHGYDVVAYFVEGRPRLGSAEYERAYAGGTYRFASEAHRDAFAADPARYVPAYGGFCAYGAAAGKKFDGDPLFWKIVSGRLFLNLDAEVQAKWSEDVAGNVARADQSWPKIEHRAAGEL